MRRPLALLGALLCCAAPAAARTPVPIGTFPSGIVDGITDVPGVRVAHVTKVEGTNVRTGATAILAGDDVGAHWVNQSGFLEVPVVLTNTLNVGRADDGVVSWLIAKRPQIGVREDVPLPVVAECDDQGINDIQGRYVHADDVVAMLDAAKPGDFARGNVGAGTGMRAFGFAAGIGSASRVLPKVLGGYTVGVLVNANTGSREELRIDGVPVGRLTSKELLPKFPPRASYLEHGRAADGSIVVAIATDAPLEARQLKELCKRAVLGLARTGITSHVSSGDLLIAFSTTRLYPRDGAPLAVPAVYEERRLDALFAATAEAAEAAVVDALLSAETMSGARNLTFYALPEARVRELLKR